VLVRDFVDLPVAFDAVAPRMVRDPGWLPQMAGDALRDALATLPELARPGADSHLPVVDCGPMQRRAASLVLPLRWSSRTPGAGIPRLDGDLRFSPVPTDRSRLTLLAHCLSSGPPAPSTDVVESGVRIFLETLSALLRDAPLPGGWPR
jgi:hypothetical protein